MTRIAYKRHRFPAAASQHAVWLYFRFTLSLRDVEEMLVHRGVDVSYESIRVWTVKFGPNIAANLRRSKQPPSPRWHLDEMVSTAAGEHLRIWRAVDGEGEVMDKIVQNRRDAGAALRLLRRLLKNHNAEPEAIVTKGLRSYRAALDRLDLIDRVLSDLRYLVSAKGRGYWPCGDPNDANFLQTSPLPADRNPARGLALFPIHA